MALTVKTSDFEGIFTAADQLELLQLTTRRAVATRRARQDVKSDSAAAESLAAHEDEIPERWRLVPDGIPLYQWQEQCLPLWLKNGRGTVKVATGGGKTLFALAAAQRLQNETVPGLRLVVVVPTIPLMFQWRDELLLGNLPARSIGLMGGGQELPLLTDMRVLVCVLNSARDRLPDLVRRAGWSDRMLLVVDECHRAGATQARHIFDSRPRYTLGLSATPEPDLESSVPADAAYESSVTGRALGPIIFDFTLRESMEAGLLTPFELWHIGLPLTDAEALTHDKLSREIADLRKELQARHRSSRSRQSFLAWCQTQASHGWPSGGRCRAFHRARQSSQEIAVQGRGENASNDGNSH